MRSQMPCTTHFLEAGCSVYQPREQRSPRRPLALSHFSLLSTTFYPPLLQYARLM